jgi:hypothetical protein
MSELSKCLINALIVQVKMQIGFVFFRLFPLFRKTVCDASNHVCNWRTFSDFPAQIEVHCKLRAFQIYSSANLHPRGANDAHFRFNGAALCDRRAKGCITFPPPVT